jgi:hypothetical protein
MVFPTHVGWTRPLRDEAGQRPVFPTHVGIYRMSDYRELALVIFLRTFGDVLISEAQDARDDNLRIRDPQTALLARSVVR